jgi:hypothetical protein
LYINTAINQQNPIENSLQHKRNRSAPINKFYEIGILPFSACLDSRQLFRPQPLKSSNSDQHVINSSATTTWGTISLLLIFYCNLCIEKPFPHCLAGPNHLFKRGGRVLVPHIANSTIPGLTHLCPPQKSICPETTIIDKQLTSQ